MPPDENLLSSGSPRPRRRRPSSLLEVAATLPSVDAALDELIARANRARVDVDGWNRAEDRARLEREQADRDAEEARALLARAEEDRLREAEARAVEAEARLAEIERYAGMAADRVTAAENAARKAIAVARALAARAAEERDAAEEAAAERDDGAGLEEASPRTEDTVVQAMPTPPGADADADAVDPLSVEEPTSVTSIPSAEDAPPTEARAMPAPAPRRRVPWVGVTLAFAGGVAAMLLAARWLLPAPAAAPAAPAAVTEAAPSAAPSLAPGR